MVACHKLIQITQTPAIDFSKNAANCFDFMFEHYQTYPPPGNSKVQTWPLKQHTKTHQKLKYYIKHACSISTK